MELVLRSFSSTFFFTIPVYTNPFPINSHPPFPLALLSCELVGGDEHG